MWREYTIAATFLFLGGLVGWRLGLHVAYAKTAEEACMKSCNAPLNRVRVTVNDNAGPNSWHDFTCACVVNPTVEMR